MSTANQRTDMTPKNTPSETQDWHRADVIAALKKAGWSLSALSHHHGYGRTTLSSAFDRKWPKGEALIAEAIGVTPQTIWPSRYEPKHRTDVQKTVVRAYKKNKQASAAQSDTRKAA